MLHVDVISLFPEMFAPVIGLSIVGRAMERGLAGVRVHDLLDGLEPGARADERPYGGGPGMVLRIEPLARTLDGILAAAPGGERRRIVLTAAAGRPFTHPDAAAFAALDRLILICGHYEGVDERLAALFPVEEFSLGPFVLTGGEIAAMAFLDATVRLIDGVIAAESRAPNRLRAAPTRSIIRRSRGRRCFAASPFPTCCSPAITRRSRSGAVSVRANARRRGGVERAAPSAAAGCARALCCSRCARRSTRRATATSNSRVLREPCSIKPVPIPRFTRVFGKIDLSDAALAVTLAQSRAQLILPDSSSIDIGATTRVRLGAFNAVDTGNPNVIVLELGALHFTIRHPAGGRANYRFVTPTSQIAVRGTDGYIVTGPTGTDFYCVDCKARRRHRHGRQSQLRTRDRSASDHRRRDRCRSQLSTSIAQPCANPAAIALSDGKLGAAIPVGERFDTTGALKGNPMRAVLISY